MLKHAVRAEELKYCLNIIQQKNSSVKTPTMICHECLKHGFSDI